MAEHIVKAKKMVEHEYTVEHKITCDLCGKDCENPDGVHGPSWARSDYDIDRVVVGTKVGSSYPEGGNYRKEQYDICPTCYEEKLKPFLHSLGVTPRVGEVDW